MPPFEGILIEAHDRRLGLRVERTDLLALANLLDCVEVLRNQA